MMDTQKKNYSIPAYQELLILSEEKLEYHAGRVEAMAGGSPDHNKIKADTYGHIYSKLTDKCEPFDSDTAIRIEAFDRFVFPDMSFICGEKPEYYQSGIAQLVNPQLIIEVLSPGTEEYDRADKFKYYRSLPSFKEYVLIHSQKYSVETFVREQNDLWRIRSAYHLDQKIRIETLDIELSLKDIYKRVSVSS